jgi:hypothetical protein
MAENIQSLSTILSYLAKVTLAKGNLRATTTCAHNGQVVDITIHMKSAGPEKPGEDYTKRTIRISPDRPDVSAEDLGLE